MEQRDSTPLKHHSETANPNMTTTQTCHFHETLRLCSEMHHLSCMTYHFYANHNGIAAQTDTRHVHEKSLFGALPNGRAIGAGFEHLRTVADGCGRLRSLANTKTTTGEHSSTLRLPKLNENPSLRIREQGCLSSSSSNHQKKHTFWLGLPLLEKMGSSIATMFLNRYFESL